MSDMNRLADTVSIEVILAMPQVQYRLALAVPQGTGAREAVRLALEAGLLPVGADIDNLPLHVYREAGETRIKPCAEALLTERAIGKIMNSGFM